MEPAAKPVRLYARAWRGETLAWTVQAIAALGLAAGLVVLWRSRAAYELKAAALAAGALIATPYVYIYDLVVLAVAVAFLLRLALQRGFTTSEIVSLPCAGALLLAFPFVKTQVGLAAALIILALVVLRASGPSFRIAVSGKSGIHNPSAWGYTFGCRPSAGPGMTGKLMEIYVSTKSRWLGLALLLVAAIPAPARAAEPIKIGLGMSLTGKLAANGKMALLAMQIWEDDINAAGGLIGRPVKLVYYDDQSDPAQVPGIYTKLLDVDKVDLIVSGYASTQIAAAMPIAIERKKLFIGLSGTAINDAFHYPMYFAMVPNGPTTKPAFTHGFFKVAEAQSSQAADHSARLCRRRVRRQYLRGRARQRLGLRLQDRLRQELSAGDGRFRPDRARHPGGQSGPRGDLFLSARHRRHDQGDP